MITQYQFTFKPTSESQTSFELFFSGRICPGVPVGRIALSAEATEWVAYLGPSQKIGEYSSAIEACERLIAAYLTRPLPTFEEMEEKLAGRRI